MRSHTTIRRCCSTRLERLVPTTTRLMQMQRLSRISVTGSKPRSSLLDRAASQRGSGHQTAEQEVKSPASEFVPCLTCSVLYCPVLEIGMNFPTAWVPSERTGERSKATLQKPVLEGHRERRLILCRSQMCWRPSSPSPLFVPCCFTVRTCLRSSSKVARFP